MAHCKLYIEPIISYCATMSGLCLAMPVTKWPQVLGQKKIKLNIRQFTYTASKGSRGLKCKKTAGAKETK